MVSESIGYLKLAMFRGNPLVSVSCSSFFRSHIRWPTVRRFSVSPFNFWELCIDDNSDRWPTHISFLPAFAKHDWADFNPRKWKIHPGFGESACRTPFWSAPWRLLEADHRTLRWFSDQNLQWPGIFQPWGWWNHRVCVEILGIPTAQLFLAQRFWISPFRLRSLLRGSFPRQPLDSSWTH